VLESKCYQQRMDVSVAHPIIFVSVANLWNDVTLLVNGIVPPPSGQPSPTREGLASLDSSSPGPVTVGLPVVGGQFKYSAVELAVALSPNDTGTATVSFSRDEDPPNPDGSRPIFKTVDLQRNAGGPLLIDLAIQLVGK
jgi:hypothetical protein